MRVWVGPELEGFNKGVITVFIEALVVNADQVINMFKLAKERTNQDIKRIYLGAGGKGLEKLVNHTELLSFAKNNDIKLVIELYNNQINTVNIDLLSQVEVIYTIVCLKDSIINYIKTDDHKLVNVYGLQNNITTDLTTLKNGLFEEDVLIYEEER